MKRIKTCVVLMLVIATLLNLIFSSFVRLNVVHAAIGDGVDTLTTARQKLWYATLAGCIGSKDAWRFDKTRDGTLLIGAISADHLKDDKWFDSNAMFAFDGGSRITWGGGAYVESMVGGEYKDGKIYCGENDNKLVKTALSELGLAEREVICNADGKEGVMYGDIGKGWDCITAYDNNGELELDSDRGNYFADLVTEKTFGNSIPGGSLTALTDLETYYIYRDDFMSACAIGDPRFGDESQPYQIQVLNEETGKFEVAGYAQRNKPSTKVYTFKGESKTCEELSDILNDSEYFDAYEERYNNREDYNDPGASDNYAAGGEGSSSSGDDAVCYKQSGAIGWIICPIIKGASKLGESLYSVIEENFLQIRSNFFETDSNLEQVWGIFRDFANIAFIILLLIVIFSQLTGVGIDNYGIKKILPKLIITAVLVNLSFIICEILSDLSNIFGAGLKDLFADMASAVSIDSGHSVGVGNSLAVVGLGGGGAVLFGLFSTGFAGLGAAVVAGGLAVLGVVISLVVSILFLFLILMVRNAGIVILIAISPVAFVCYLLPNTEKFFKKWFDLFKALLIVYPLCGLMIGGGILAGHVLASVGSAPMAIAGMVAEVLPYFLIPMLLRQSLSLLGNVGARISSVGRNIGRGMSSGASRGVTNSEGYKNAIQFDQNQRAFRRARRVVNRLTRRSGGNPINLSSRGRDRLVSATKTLNDQTQRREEARAGVAVINAGVAYQEKQNERTKQEAKNMVGVAALNMDTVRQQLQNERLKTDVEMEVGVAPLNRDNLRQRTQNAVNEAIADNRVPVLPVDVNLAEQRRRSANSAQTLRNYQDQFAGFSQAQLRAEAAQANTWLGRDDGSQRMSALLSAMEANGMERDIFNTLRNNDVSRMSGVMQALAGSKNKVLKAYGKKGYDSVNDSPVDFNHFMDGTGSQSLQAYINDKGKDFIDGLDDKALEEISRHTVNGVRGGAMSSDLLMEAGAKLKGRDAAEQIAGILSTRNDVSMTGEQLVNIDRSLQDKLMANASARAAMIRASDDVASNPRLIGRMDTVVRGNINALRTGPGGGGRSAI